MKKTLLAIICGILFNTTLYSQFTESNNGIEHGYIFSFALDPVTNYLYAGSYGRGIYVSTDNGNNWSAINNGLSGNELLITSIAIDGNNIYAGTEGAGLFLSNNGGALILDYRNWKSAQ
jgi:photosystem II stability/assembly factor-like uncharacterized protein